MRITVVMAARNAEAFIARALASVAPSLAGQGGDVEILVADGASTDRTIAIAQSGPRVRIVSTADSGLYDGMNRAIAAATGDAVIILNSDDELLPGGLAAAAAVLASANDVAHAAGPALLGREIESARPLIPRLAMTAEGVLFGVPAINARLFRLDLLKRLGPIRTDIGLGADREFLLRVVRSGAKGAASATPLYFYRAHEGSHTISGDERGRRRIYKSDAELASALLQDAAVSARERRAVQAFLALSRLKSSLRGHGGDAAAEFENATSFADAARGLTAYIRWRRFHSGW